jgi:hypothetical protein
MFKKPKLNKQSKLTNFAFEDSDEFINTTENQSTKEFNSQISSEFSNKIEKNNNKNDLELNEQENEENKKETNLDKVLRLKANIDNNLLNSKKRETIKIEGKYEPVLSKEEQADRGIKKIFISENELTNSKDNPEEYKKLVGIKKEEIDNEKESKRQKIFEHQKDLFTLPIDLQVTPQTKNDYVENLIRLSTAGLIEVPLSLENKLKNIEATEIMKKQIIDKKLGEELDYLKVLKKNGPSYSKGYKNDISHKKLRKLNSVFENVFMNFNGRKRKLLKEKMILDNKVTEYGYDPTGGNQSIKEEKRKRRNFEIEEESEPDE